MATKSKVQSRTNRPAVQAQQKVATPPSAAPTTTTAAPVAMGNQGNQGNDGRGRVVDPATDGRIGNNTNRGGQNNQQLAERTDDLRETLGQGDQSGAQRSSSLFNGPDDPRTVLATRLLDMGVQMLALGAVLFKEVDVETGVVEANVDNRTYAQGIYDGLQDSIAEKMEDIAQAEQS